MLGLGCERRREEADGESEVKSNVRGPHVLLRFNHHNASDGLPSPRHLPQVRSSADDSRSVIAAVLGATDTFLLGIVLVVFAYAIAFGGRARSLAGGAPKPAAVDAGAAGERA